MKTGWILQAENSNGKDRFIDKTGNDVARITQADVFDTREKARKCEVYHDYRKLPSDVVRKVELNKYGKAIKIIKGR